MRRMFKPYASLGLVLAMGLAAAGCNSMGMHHDEKDDHEQSIGVDKVPAVVVAGLKKAMPDAVITEAATEMEDGKMIYDLDVKSGGKAYDVDMSPEGKVLKSEEDKEDEKDHK